MVCLCQVPMPEPSLLTLQATWPGTLVRFLFFCVSFLCLQLYTFLPVFAVHEQEIPITSRTAYMYINDGLLDVRNIDLRRQTRQNRTFNTKSQTCSDGLALFLLLLIIFNLSFRACLQDTRIPQIHYHQEVIKYQFLQGL
ncbi:hypothetical protein SAMN02910382_01224 [Butyrivibrio sp. TB]|nr:hypothetical protein SAMN02910382_01224 [Butyrivibrio sp. TB]